MKKEQELAAEQQRLKQERDQQEQAKLDFIKRLEQEQAAKQAAFKAAFLVKQKEQRLQSAELALMAHEDRLSRHCRTLMKLAQRPAPKPSAAPAAAKAEKKVSGPTAAVASKSVVAAAVEPAPAPVKKPYVPRQAISAAKIAEMKAKEQSAEELALLEFKRLRDEKYNSEEAIKRNREAVQRRVAAKLARAAQQQQEKEMAEKELKLKLDQVANESKKHLQHVLTRDQAVKKFARSKLKGGKRKHKGGAGAAAGGAHDILISDEDDDESDEERRKQEYQRIISSAKEDFPVGEGDFEIEDFFDQTSLMQLYVAPERPTSAAVAAAAAAVVNKPPSPVAVVVSKKVLPAVPAATGAPGKPKAKGTVNIPKFLRNTPYFVDYEKHTEVPEIKPSGVKPTLNRKNTPPFNGGLGNNNNSSPGEQPDDFHFVKRSHGKVASLIETISEARKNSADPNNREDDEQPQTNTSAAPVMPPPIETKGLTDLKIPGLGSTKFMSLNSGTTRTPATNTAAAPISFKFAPPSIPIPAMSESDLKLLRSVKKRPSEMSTGAGVSSKSNKQTQNVGGASTKEKSGKAAVSNKIVKKQIKEESDSEEENEAAEELKLLNDYAVLKQRLTASFNADNDRRGMSHENLPLDNDQDTLVPRSIKMTEEDDMMGDFGGDNDDDDGGSERSDYDDDVAEQEERAGVDDEVLNELDEREDLQSDEEEEEEEQQGGGRAEVNLDDDDCLQLLQSLTAKINK